MNNVLEDMANIYKLVIDLVGPIDEKHLNETLNIDHAYIYDYYKMLLDLHQAGLSEKIVNVYQNYMELCHSKTTNYENSSNEFLQMINSFRDLYLLIQLDKRIQIFNSITHIITYLSIVEIAYFLGLLLSGNII